MGEGADTVGKIYDAFGTGDMATVLGAMDPKIDWQEPASLPFENQIGPQAVAENVFAVLGEKLQDFSVTPREVIDGGDIVAVVGRYTGRGAANAVELDADFVHVWRFGADGKVAGFRTYTDTALWLRALGAD